MKQKLRLSIPTPCHEDWEKMLPLERGRHCQQCCKTVVDFTGMSDEEVVKFFVGRARGGVCGRFAPDQLGRELEPAPVQRNGVKGWPWVVAGALVMGQGPEDGARSVRGMVEKRQTGDLRKMSDTSVLLQDTSREPFVGTVAFRTYETTETIQGDIVLAPDSTMPVIGEPVAGDTLPEILPADTVIGKVIPKDEAFTGLVTIVPDRVIDIDTPLDTVSRIKFGIDTVVNWWKDSVAGVAAALGVGSGEMVKVFPNPVMRGGMMRLAWSAVGKYSAAILDLHGQIVQERVGEVSGTGQVDEWALPNGMAAGVYFLRVARPGEKVWTKEIVVQ